MYGTSLRIFNVHVQRPRSTKFHPNRMNPAELWRHFDFSRSRPRRGNSTSDFVFWWLRLIRKVEIYLQTKFRWHFWIHCWDITTSGFLTQMTAMLEFYFRFQFSFSSHHRYNTLRRPTKFYPNRTTTAWRNSDFQHGGHGIAILLPFSFFVTAQPGRPKSTCVPNFGEIS